MSDYETKEKILQNVLDLEAEMDKVLEEIRGLSSNDTLYRSKNAELESIKLAIRDEYNKIALEHGEIETAYSNNIIRDEKQEITKALVETTGSAFNNNSDFVSEKNINLKRQIQLIEDNKKRNRAYSDIVWGIINILTVIICVVALSKQTYFPIKPIIVNTLILSLLVIGILRLVIGLVIIWYRDNMNFERFIWPWWYPTGDNNLDGTGSISGDLSFPPMPICSGSDSEMTGSICCGLGTRWDSSARTCMPTADVT
jgi:hypothetical protein